MFTEVTSLMTTLSAPKKVLSVVGLALALTGCISPNAREDGRYTTPIGDAPVIDNETPYSSALRCVGTQIRQSGSPLRIAVGNIRDYTGKVEDEGGHKVTQGAALMAMSALNKTGVRLVERFDTAITELELKYANNKLIGSGNGDYRRINAGVMPASDYYLVGGITELNYDIRNGRVDGFFSETGATALQASASMNLFVMNIGLDLRLVNSKTLEVVDVVSYQKQIIGQEISAGIFDFFGGNIFDIGVDEYSVEPLQLAVRSVIERAVLEMMVPLHSVRPATCGEINKNDPMGKIDFKAPSKSNARAAQAAPAPAPYTARVATSTPDRAVSNPYNYYAEPIFNSGLRGGVN